MDPKDLRDITDQLDLLSRRLEAIEVRLGMRPFQAFRESIPVARPAEPQAEPPPPPVITTPLSTRPRPPEPSQPIPRIQAPPKPNVDLEYMLGAKALPWAAALILLIGIGTLVSLGFANGWITPIMLWWGGAILSGAFVLVGQWKREEREQFGQILTGIGSCGLYLTFAAGYAAQHLYSGEVLVVQFLILSLINLGYSFWRASTAFLAIGVIGGFAAALMPLQKENLALNIGLHMLILASASGIAAYRNWWNTHVVLGGLGLVLLIPGFLTNGPDTLKIAACYANAAIVLLAYLQRPETNWDEQNTFPVILAVTAGCIAFGLLHGPQGAAHLVAWSAALAAIALTAKLAEVRDRVLLASALLATALAPFGAGLNDAPFWLGALSIAVCGFAVWRRLRIAQFLGVLLAALGIGAYLVRALDHPIPWPQEVAVLTLLFAASCANLIADWRLNGRRDSALAAAAIVLAPLFIRACNSFLIGAEGADIWLATGLGSAMASLGFSFVFRRLRAAVIEPFAWIAFALAAVSFVNFAGEAPKIALEAPLAVGCALASAVLFLQSSLRNDEDSGPIAEVFGTWVTCAFLIGTAYRVLNEGAYHIAILPSLILAFGFFGLVTMAIGQAKSTRSIGYATFGFLAVSLAFYGLWLVGPSAPGLAQETAFNLGLSIWAISAFVLLARAGVAVPPVATVAAWVLWPLFSRLVTIHSAGFLGPEAASAASTIVLLAAAIACNRRWQSDALRASSFFWYGALGLAYASITQDHGASRLIELVLNACVAIATYAIAAEFAGHAKDKATVWLFAGIAGWGLADRFGQVLMTSPNIGMTGNAAQTLSWTVYAVSLLVIGFARGIAPLRLFGLGVFALTAAKVVLVDLAEVQPVLRVIVSMALGLAMLGVGYWYVRHARPVDV